MRSLASRLDKISSTWLMAATLAIMVGFLVFVLPGQSAAADRISQGAESPDLSFFYAPEQLYQMAEEYGLGGRQAYITARWSFDLIFPLVYVSFLATGISWFSARMPGWKDKWWWCNLLPLGAGLFDLLENSGATLAMALYPQRNTAALLLASISTPIKWVLVGASFLLYFALAGGVLLHWARSSRKD